jgi:pyridoxal phosphate enzyme (YggS family)
LATLPDPGSVAEFHAARSRVLETVAEACGRAGRDPASIQLLAVSKLVGADRLGAAVAAGLTLLGENRVQEAESKAPSVPGAHWHLIGPLQSNKARRAVELFEVIESVDSIELARRLDRLAGETVTPGAPGAESAGQARFATLGVYLQVNVDRDAAKAGFLPEALAAELPALVSLPNLSLLGLMTVGRLVESPEEARPTFVRLRELSVRLRVGMPALGGGLSMGMSDDYAVAVEEGATVIRVGRALFGERPGPDASSGPDARPGTQDRQGR